jgi:stress response protein SCP2
LVVDDQQKVALDTATQASLAKADSALQEVEAGYGITVTKKADGKQEVSLDTVSILIIDCGSAMDVI